ncbi:hypothetical protein [Pacificoceanicola onchidii]|uniref:hypothetical protein n=1 Tax=Pacificoceanicola onchidii TaxID=2562685 RepID=UPI0010A617B9|nr:hypothetical protein [Pacificoceanicola onchidii]
MIWTSHWYAVAINAALETQGSASAAMCKDFRIRTKPPPWGTARGFKAPGTICRSAAKTASASQSRDQSKKPLKMLAHEKAA